VELSLALKTIPINKTLIALRELSLVYNYILLAKRRAVAVIIPLRAKDGASTPANRQ